MEHYCKSGDSEATTRSSCVGLARSPFWRPWSREQHRPMRKKGPFSMDSKMLSKFNKKPSGLVHPVKLFWPKSRCFDYLYQDAEALLRNYPVQATICPYADSSDEDEPDDTDEEDDKEAN